MQTIQKNIYILIFIVFSLSLAINITILLSPLIYTLVVKFFDLNLAAGLTQEQLLDNYNVILNYLVNPTVNELSMPFFSSSEGGMQHFAEVKVLFFINFIITITTFGLCILGFKQIRQNGWQLDMRLGFSFAAVLPLIVLMVIIVAFDQVFVLFHRLLFNNDLWLFNPILDPVITVLPQGFFMVLFMLALLIYECIILLLRFIVNRS